MEKIAALEIDRRINLMDLSRYLQQAGVRHRIHEQGEQQVVWVDTPEARDAVLAAYEHFQRGELPRVNVRGPAVRANALKADILRSPLTVTVILANLICYPATWGIDDGKISIWLQFLSLLDIYVRGDQLYFADLAYTFEAGQWWRLVTPMLLHFSLLHIVFNLLWVWEIGRRIERQCGALWLLAITLVTSVSANLTQYFLSGASLFGGMSGVVFGLLGFALVWRRLQPSRDLGLPPGVYIFMLVFLVVGFTGAFDLLGLGSLANGAHLGGLLGGLLLGFIAVSLSQSPRRA